MEDFEKLGLFYLGKQFNQATRERSEDLLLYDSRDLCTHAVVVGMTGSGKTGLCIDLIEEAAIDRIPSIVIDPKGDIANLLLTFPGLSAEEFRPWIDEGQASRKGMTPDEFAAAEAEKWKSGLAGWGQTGERIQKLRDTVEMRVYTPGSNAGRPITILKSFSAPGESIVNDSDAFHDRISSATSGLLALLRIDADPINSQEHILISKILEHAWRDGKDLDLGKMIARIQKPPFDRVGVMELDDFYPAKDRQSLAMTLNNLLASPSFSNWLEGEPLDIKRMLHTPEGKPCISIVSIAHLSDEERMFFVTILLNEMISWMRSQSGTSSLRALLYMDEVFGFFPPVQNPPSKKPMLTLLKQARSFGLGCILATQNPVDLDYKGLSNAGTWFLGRLQTERDKARVLEGLEGASSLAGASFDRAEMEKTLAGLGSRVFLMNNVHDDQPVVFETRWAMSYLRGPLTRNQIKQLTPVRDTADPVVADSNRPSPVVPPPGVEKESVDPRTLIPAGVEQFFVEPNEIVLGEDRLVFRPALLGRGRLHFARATYHVDQWVDKTYLAPVEGEIRSGEMWEDATEVVELLDFSMRPDDGAEYEAVSPSLQKSKEYKSWQKELKDFFYRSQEMSIWKCVKLKKYSDPDETQGDFMVRLEQVVSEIRDEKTEKLKRRFGKKFAALRSRLRRAEDKIEVEKEQYKQSRLSSALSIGSTLMGALLGRRYSRKATTSVRSMGRSAKERGDIGRAEDNLDDLKVKYEDLELEFNDEVAELEEKLSVENLEFVEYRIPPRKSDISIEEFGVCWLPFRVSSSGIATPIY